jgi:2-C-methyl-D-erythritol 4-phosphate cytidylyltransferase
MDEFAVIVAGGSGTRLKSKLPKQFIEVGSLPILMHTINQFRNYSQLIKIILVLPENEVNSWNNLCEKYQFSQENITIVLGGNTRFQSCRNGIKAIKSIDALVAIHDGVRPFVLKEIIEKGFVLAKEKGSAVCCVASKDSARYLTDDGLNNRALDRLKLKLIQTPQTFQLKILQKAYSSPELALFTDDASVVEHADFTINLYEGSYNNIKITTSEDLAMAEILHKNLSNLEK